MNAAWTKKISILLIGLMVLMAGCNFSGKSSTEPAENKEGDKQAEQAEGKSENVLNLSLDNDIPDLNQVKTTDAISFAVLNNVMEGLYRLDENNEPQPAMAESYEKSEDGLTYTFTLREGIKWSNGDPVTANDFKYSWLRSMHPDTAGAYASILTDYIKGGAEFAAGEAEVDAVAIEVKDDKTLVVELVQPTPFFLGLTAFVTYFPLNEKFVSEQGDKFALTHDAILYNGPFILTDYDQAKGVSMDKNQEYWDKESVALEQVNMKVIKEQSTALNLYEAGELDKVYLSSADVDSYKDSPEFNTETEFRTYFIQFNLGKEPFQNKNILKALQLGYDPEVLTSVVLNNGSEPAYGLIASDMAGVEGKSFREIQGDVIKPDAEKAKELWEKGVEELGKTPEIELLISDDTVSKDTGTFLQSEYKKNLGIDISLDTQPYSARLDSMRADDYQMAVNRWGADYNDAMTYLNLWANPSNPFFRGNYVNEKYKELVNSAAEDADDQSRIEKLLEAEKLILEDGALGPLYYDGLSFLQKPYLKGLVTHPYGASPDLKWATVQ
ncbi:MAG: peptide ABC transporter substrate-binding protein [Bacillota bacterium]|uniref:ABC transporter, substrate-binding protein (Cluster 5, nickel/peptides/opines) n=1 Tax=Cytobacillus firmus TaxID=1399 RepID=A0A7Y5AXA4_CYTFI|nr:peptide ABC transporter substrate-binding protein [Cytobacillus firmus]KAF0824621.1 ABC transporter, substrate-binding protein (cluster 5, nickel/peptides/opines) [Cytobacillus firmus]MBG9654552.1 ABC transporter substrate-binding protein [Cytobacillus firmus]MED1905624.1 peptide ABC transporter substrate-binding protein [Cytobacillus firmus]NUH83690.1 peptide ABC transporter substrate-binding protein [Cytobacillus firmus]